MDIIVLYPYLCPLFFFPLLFKNLYPLEQWNPSDEETQKELDEYRGTYKNQVNYRLSMYESSENSGKTLIGIFFLLDFCSRSFGMMFVEMAYFSNGLYFND